MDRRGHRPLYHAALALGANHLVTLVAQSMELLRKAGVAAPDRMLGPLLGAALDNALRSGDAALTGPVARGDAGTVAAHVAELRRHAPTSAAIWRWPARPPTARSPRPAQARAGRGPLLGVLADGATGRGATDRRTDAASRPATARRPPGERGRWSRTRARSCTTPRRPADRGDVAVVMTMGALHEGHATLIRDRARARAADVVVTVFLNPLQFGAERGPRPLPAHLRRRPRDLPARPGVDARLRALAGRGLPRRRPQVRISAGRWATSSRAPPAPATSTACSPSSPSCCTSPAPDVAYFGQKDAQQLLLIRRMVRDLDFPVGVVGVPTVREPDGLAMSSRNRYLTASDREVALCLSRALRAGADAAAEGPSAIRRAARAVRRRLLRRTRFRQTQARAVDQSGQNVGRRGWRRRRGTRDGGARAFLVLSRAATEIHAAARSRDDGGRNLRRSCRKRAQTWRGRERRRQYSARTWRHTRSAR